MNTSSRINSHFYNFRERSFVHENIKYHRHETTHQVSAQHEKPPLQHPWWRAYNSTEYIGAFAIFGTKSLLTAGHSRLGCVYGVYAPWLSTLGRQNLREGPSTPPDDTGLSYVKMA